MRSPWRRGWKAWILPMLAGVSIIAWSTVYCLSPIAGGVCSSLFSPSPSPFAYRPDTGIVRDRASGTRPAPLKIITSSGRYYFVKFSSDRGNHFDIWIYIRGGETFQGRMPLGTFILRYATGSKWIDYDHLFGSGTEYQQADKPIVFSGNASGTIGHTIELVGQINGNLPTRSIRGSDF